MSSGRMTARSGLVGALIRTLSRATECGSCGRRPASSRTHLSHLNNVAILELHNKQVAVPGEIDVFLIFGEMRIGLVVIRASQLFALATSVVIEKDIARFGEQRPFFVL